MEGAAAVVVAEQGRSPPPLDAREATMSDSASMSGDGQGSEPPRLKVTCENCVRAKVKCSGLPGPCERCSGWRKLDCVFLEERKRGRPRLPDELKKSHQHHHHLEHASKVVKVDGDETQESGRMTRGRAGQTTNRKQSASTSTNPKLFCVTTDCWSKVRTDEFTRADDAIMGSPSEGLSNEQARLVEIFFTLYKNHASNRSCCKAWFSRQLNKIAGLLKAAGSYDAMVALFEWMNRHHILVSPLAPPEKKAFQDPMSGFLMPPMSAPKGPMLNDRIVNMPPSTIEEPMRNPDCACLKVSYTRDEICTIKTSPRFVEMLGKDADYFRSYLDTLYGGILPWGGDLFANIISAPTDTVTLIRMLADEFAKQPRMMDSQPVTRKANNAQIFQCTRLDGTQVYCIVRMEHVEVLSYEGVEVTVIASFEPYTLLPPIPCYDLETPANAPPTVQEVVEPTHGALPFEHESGLAEKEAEFAPDGEGDYGDLWFEDILKWVDEPNN